MYIWEQKFKNFDEARKFQQGQGFSGKRWKQSQLEILSTVNKIQRNFKYLDNNIKYFKINTFKLLISVWNGVGYCVRQNLNTNLNFNYRNTIYKEYKKISRKRN